MAEREQSLKNHRRYYPWHHYVVQPILIVNLGVEIARALKDPAAHGWPVMLAFALVVFSFTSRGMALKAQDRVIRLEERLRLAQLMPGEQAVIDSLRPGQLVALRFASDDEVADLARRCASGDLVKGEQIKKEIQTWRPDYLRV
jgi:hypothetical protein